MKILCDVHISFKVVKFFNSRGFEATHVNRILDKSFTKDSAICHYADLNDFILISKDSDFRDSYFIRRTPKKLIKINLGNVSNENLLEILTDNVSRIETLYSRPNFIVEIGNDRVEFIELE